jgi:hypothetical protein
MAGISGCGNEANSTGAAKETTNTETNTTCMLNGQPCPPGTCTVNGQPCP